MAANIEKPMLLKVAELFDQHGIEFIVIGGQASALHGSSYSTYDVDLCYRRSEDNLLRIAQALKKINPTLRGAPPDLPFTLDARSLALGSNFTFNTDLGPLDLLGWVEPLGSFEERAKNAETFSIGGRDICVIGLDDLVRVKQHILRPKDRVVLEDLLSLQSIRRES
jgi:predicted nucleotidyltransferase